ncbi:MAG: DUF308 domain-containing protein [Lachnospiraceae bacterium]|nr:DUF308 domain-containing protein [Lachnospiraceae bacterium]
MSNMKRVGNIFIGILMIVFAVILFIYADAYRFVATTMAVVLMVFGIGQLIYFIDMARMMVGGFKVLVSAIFMIDMGAFTFSITDMPKFFVMMYLLIVYGFTGALHILRALESKRERSSWKFNMTHGVTDIILAVLCAITFWHYSYLVAGMFSLSIIYSGIMRIISAFRKTTLVYVQ